MTEVKFHRLFKSAKHVLVAKHCWYFSKECYTSHNKSKVDALKSFPDPHKSGVKCQVVQLKSPQLKYNEIPSNPTLS